MSSTLSTESIEIEDSVWNELEKHVKEEYPLEACGLLAGKSDSLKISGIYRIENEAENPRVRYKMNPKEQYKAIEDLEEKGSEIRCIYHSHPDMPVFFSEIDKERGTLEDKPIFDASYLVISVRNGEVADYGFFGWDEEKELFERISKED